MRDIEKNPYSKDEARVAKFFADLGVGGGDDPIENLIVAHQYVIAQRNSLRTALEDAVETLEAMDLHIENPLYQRLRTALEQP